MSDLNLQRTKVILLAVGVACMSGGFVLLRSALLGDYPKVMLVCVAFIVVALFYTIWEFVKLKRSER